VDLAELLAKLRTARGMSQEQLAVSAAVSVRAIGDLERGATRRPQRNTIDALATALTLTDDERSALHAAARRHPPRPSRPRSAVPPPSPTALVGRAKDVAAVTELLRHAPTRMVTITGPAGVGKSRLAHEVARRVTTAFQRIGQADLALIDAQAAAASEIERSLDAGRSRAGTFDAIATHIAADRWLLVLDGPDRVAGIAPELAELLTRCPRLSLLVTCRTPMRLRAEQLWPLPGLPTAVDLLVERTRLVRPGYAPASTDALASLCDLLEGVPLAIELAAIGLRTRDPDELVGPLAGGGDPVARVVAWAIDGVDDDAGRVLAVLGAFRGGAFVDAVRAVMAHAELPADRFHASVAALVGAGLITVEDRGGRARILVPQASVQEAAERRLRGLDVARAVHTAHARHVGEVIRSAFAPSATATDGADVGDRADLVDERDNVRMAIQWGAAHKQGAWDDATVTAVAAYLAAHASAAEATHLLAVASTRVPAPQAGST
jgi:transcriptional regulator with XRE-family HTH domain